MLIGGRRVESASGQSFESFQPVHRQLGRIETTMKCSKLLVHAFSGVALTALAGPALCAPHLEPCNRIPNDYEERVERLMRDAWPQEMTLLAILYSDMVHPTERGIGLTRDGGGFNVIRLEFDKSFWYSSWRDVEPGSGDARSPDVAAVATEVYRADGRPLGARVLDFSKTRVRVAKLSIPISQQLGNALLATFEHAADTARVEAAGAEGLTEIVTDGYKFEVLLSGRPCVELANPPPESEAGRLAGLVRFLDKRTLSWRRSERMEFEADVTRMITAADVRRGELEPPR